MHVFPYTPSVGNAWINSRRCSAQLMTLFLWPLMSYLSYYANKPRKQATQGNSEPNTACFFFVFFDSAKLLLEYVTRISSQVLVASECVGVHSLTF